MSDEQIAQLTDAAFNAAGDLLLGFTTPTGVVRLRIPKEKAMDALIPLLYAVAKTSQRPGPHYQAHLSVAEVVPELVQPERGRAIPCLSLQFDRTTRLRVALPEHELEQIAQGIQNLRESLRTKPKGH